MKPFYYLLIIAACLVVIPASALYHDTLYLGEGKYNESFPGERNAGQWYTFHLNNASGLADVDYHFTIVDAEIRKSYQYRSDAWGQWWNETPDPGTKFLFVWICGYSEGTSWIGWGSDRFAAWVDGQTIQADPVVVSDIGKIRRGGAFTDKVPPRTIAGMENKSALPGFAYASDAYGFKDGIELSRMEPGKSNAFYGYLIYRIPEKAELKDIQIAGWFGYYGTAIWNLQPKMYTQDSPESKIIKEKEEIQKQILLGRRLSDRDVSQGSKGRVKV